MRVDKHTTTWIVDQDTAQRLVNSPYFVSSNELTEDCVEVTLRKKWTSCRMPRQIGLMIYQLAKLELLRMYYDLIDTFVPRNRFQAQITDTDSIYISLAGTSLRECVKPERLRQYDRVVRNWMPQDLCDAHYDERQRVRERGEDDSTFLGDGKCCQDARAFQRRTLGLWKVECESDAIIALAPKAYVCYNFLDSDNPNHNNTSTVKTSHKGVQASNMLNAKHFAGVLHTRDHKHFINRGIKLCPDKLMRTYRQEKRGLSYLYTKREVLDDGISTIPLKI